MPNLSPKKFRKLYSIYDNKIGTGSESAEGLKILKEQVERAGYEIVVARGDFKE
jgi:biotin synthase